MPRDCGNRAVAPSAADRSSIGMGTRGPPAGACAHELACGGRPMPGGTERSVAGTVWKTQASEASTLSLASGTTPGIGSAAAKAGTSRSSSTRSRTHPASGHCAGRKSSTMRTTPLSSPRSSSRRPRAPCTTASGTQAELLPKRQRAAPSPGLPSAHGARATTWASARTPGSESSPKTSPASARTSRSATGTRSG
jgi:hypothetical protein